MKTEILQELFEILEARKAANPDESYAASLYKKGSKKIAKKLGEEATELVIEAIRLEAKPKSDKRAKAFREEAADLLFHYLVLLAHHNVPPEEILEILKGRMGTSGLAEKAARP